MKYENIEIIEAFPVIFVPEEHLPNVKSNSFHENPDEAVDKQAEWLMALLIEIDTIRSTLKKVIKTPFEVNCFIDNMVFVLPLMVIDGYPRGEYDPKKIIEIFDICKKHFEKVKIAVLLDGLIKVIETGI